jgi:hypothetical protein
MNEIPLEPAERKIEQKYVIPKKEAETVQKPEEIAVKQVKPKSPIEIKTEQDTLYFYDLLFSLLGDINLLMKAGARGKVSPALNKNINAMILNLTNVRKEMLTKNSNLGLLDRRKLLNLSVKYKSTVENILSNIVAGTDKTVKTRLNAKFNK